MKQRSFGFNFVTGELDATNGGATRAQAEAPPVSFAPVPSSNSGLPQASPSFASGLSRDGSSSSAGFDTKSFIEKNDLAPSTIAALQKRDAEVLAKDAAGFAVPKTGLIFGFNKWVVIGSAAVILTIGGIVVHQMIKQ